MENCTIYSHELKFDEVVAIVKKHLPKANVEIKDGGIQKSMVATLKGGFFSKTKTLTINYRQRKNPSYKLENIECGLTQNLAGMTNFIQSLPTQNETVKGQLLFKVMSMNCEMPFMAEPNITPEFQAILKEIALSLSALIFTPSNSFFKKSSSQHFLNEKLELVQDNEGNCHISELAVSVNSKYHDEPAENYLPEQIERKERSELLLGQKSVKVNKNLPCLAASEQVSLRDKKTIIERAYALLTIAARGEGVEKEQLNKVIKDKQITGFTNRETAILGKTELADNEKAYAIWRYESLTVLLWSLGIIDKLIFPDAICDVSKVVGAIIQPSRPDFEKAVQLRSKSEILEELDKIYRMHWACVDARLKGTEPTGKLNASVVYERHYALNWLTAYQNDDWDDIQTNT